MLFQAPDAAAPVRLQGVYVSDNEIQRLVIYWQSFAGAVTPAPTAAGGIVDAAPSGIPSSKCPCGTTSPPSRRETPCWTKLSTWLAARGAPPSLCCSAACVSATRARPIDETMEDRGIVGPPEPGTNTRAVLDYGPCRTTNRRAIIRMHFHQPAGIGSDRLHDVTTRSFKHSSGRVIGFPKVTCEMSGNRRPSTSCWITE